MKPKLTASFCALLITGLWCAALPARAAETGTLQSEVRQTDTLTARHGATTVQTRLVSEFGAFTGSEANAQSLVTGLRNGTPITLTSPATGSAATTTTTTTSLTFDPPTRPMGYGNVFISLALAQEQLASYGITNPTPQQLQAALTGGTITIGSGTTARTVTLQGILAQRADGMGWGAIAKSLGMNLGHVVSGLKSANQQLTSSSTASTSGSAAPGSGAQTQTQSTTTGTTTAHGRAQNAHARGAFRGETSGIVTAGGAGGGVGAGANVNAGARAGGAGIVTGSGAAARADGSGQGLAKGLNK